SVGKSREAVEEVDGEYLQHRRQGRSQGRLQLRGRPQPARGVVAGQSSDTARANGPGSSRQQVQDGRSLARQAKSFYGRSGRDGGAEALRVQVDRWQLRMA